MVASDVYVSLYLLIEGGKKKIILRWCCKMLIYVPISFPPLLLASSSDAFKLFLWDETTVESFRDLGLLGEKWTIID